jgi:hypothetical protein
MMLMKKKGYSAVERMEQEIADLKSKNAELSKGLARKSETLHSIHAELEKIMHWVHEEFAYIDSAFFPACSAKKTMMVTCRCGMVFDLVEAPWCGHDPLASIHTKECPNGHCICHKLGKKEQWRPASEDERKLGFGIMLKEEFGGVVSPSPKSAGMRRRVTFRTKDGGATFLKPKNEKVGK